MSYQVGGATKTVGGAGQYLPFPTHASPVAPTFLKLRRITDPIGAIRYLLVTGLGSTVQDTTKGVGGAVNETTDSAASSLGGKEQTGQNPLGLASDAK